MYVRHERSLSPIEREELEKQVRLETESGRGGILVCSVGVP